MEYINEIAIGAVVVLLGAHFGLHFYFKAIKKKQDKQRAAKRAAQSKETQVEKSE
jgi:cell division protein FtsB